MFCEMNSVGSTEISFHYELRSVVVEDLKYLLQDFYVHIRTQDI